jgi:hypothetical protein
MGKIERKDRYIQFPLCLLMETYRNKQSGLDLILDFGVVHFAKSFKYDMASVGVQLMYCYYKDQKIIPCDLLKTMEKYIKADMLSVDSDYSGFCAGAFDPLDYTEELLGLFESDQTFKESAILLYQIRQAASEEFLSINLRSIDGALDRYKRGIALKQNFESQFGADVMPGIKVEQIIQYRDSDQNMDIFRVYVGIKSLIGRNTFATANKPVILSRMIGCKSKAAFEYFTTDKINKNKNLLPTVEKYSKKYQMDKLLLTLAENKFIMFLSKAKVSVLYLSKYMEPEELATIVKQTKERKDLRNRIRGATASL